MSSINVNLTQPPPISIAASSPSNVLVTFGDAGNNKTIYNSDGTIAVPRVITYSFPDATKIASFTNDYIREGAFDGTRFKCVKATDGSYLTSTIGVGNEWNPDRLEQRIEVRDSSNELKASYEVQDGVTKIAQIDVTNDANSFFRMTHNNINMFVARVFRWGKVTHNAKLSGRQIFLKTEETRPGQPASSVELKLKPGQGVLTNFSPSQIKASSQGGVLITKDYLESPHDFIKLKPTPTPTTPPPPAPSLKLHFLHKISQNRTKPVK